MEKITQAIINVQNVTKTYDVSQGKFAALKNIPLKIIKDGEIINALALTAWKANRISVREALAY